MNTVKRIQAFSLLTDGDLLVLAYKLANNVYPIYKDRNDLIEFIILRLNDADYKLAGQTLPADIDKINNLKPKDI
jgi:hypothetical protein